MIFGNSLPSHSVFVHPKPQPLLSCITSTEDASALMYAPKTTKLEHSNAIADEENVNIHINLPLNHSSQGLAEHADLFDTQHTDLFDTQHTDLFNSNFGQDIDFDVYGTDHMMYEHNLHAAPLIEENVETERPAELNSTLDYVLHHADHGVWDKNGLELVEEHVNDFVPHNEHQDLNEDAPISNSVVNASLDELIKRGEMQMMQQQKDGPQSSALNGVKGPDLMLREPTQDYKPLQQNRDSSSITQKNSPTSPVQSPNQVDIAHPTELKPGKRPFLRKGSRKEPSASNRLTRPRRHPAQSTPSSALSTTQTTAGRPHRVPNQRTNQPPPSQKSSHIQSSSQEQIGDGVTNRRKALDFNERQRLELEEFNEIEKQLNAQESTLNVNFARNTPVLDGPMLSLVDSEAVASELDTESLFGLENDTPTRDQKLHAAHRSRAASNAHGVVVDTGFEFSDQRARSVVVNSPLKKPAHSYAPPSIMKKTAEVNKPNDDAKAAAEAEVEKLRVKLTRMAQELQDEIKQYQEESAHLQQLRKQHESALKEAMTQRETILQDAQKEKIATLQWCAEQKLGIDKERKVLARQLRSVNDKLKLSNTRKDRAEIDAMQATIEKLRIDNETIRKRWRASESCMTQTNRDQQQRVTQLEQQVASLDQERKRLEKLLKQAHKLRNGTPTTKTEHANVMRAGLAHSENEGKEVNLASATILAEDIGQQEDVSDPDCDTEEHCDGEVEEIDVDDNAILYSEYEDQVTSVRASNFDPYSNTDHLLFSTESVSDEYTRQDASEDMRFSDAGERYDPTRYSQPWLTSKPVNPVEGTVSLPQDSYITNQCEEDNKHELQQGHKLSNDVWMLTSDMVANSHPNKDRPSQPSLNLSLSPTQQKPSHINNPSNAPTSMSAVTHRNTGQITGSVEYPAATVSVFGNDTGSLRASTERIEEITANGTRIVRYRNGTRKETHPDGRVCVLFHNGDVKKTFPETGIVVYYYASAKTTHTSYANGLEVYEFSNNQIERHYVDGRKEIVFPDGTKKLIRPSGVQECVFADGVVVVEYPDGQKEIKHAPAGGSR